MTTFFTADHHYNHANILKYEPRPWKSVDKMNNALIRKHNEVVSPQDTVFHIGDFSLSKNEQYIQGILSKLNGIHHLVLGNHDKLKPFVYEECGFVSIHTSLAIYPDESSKLDLVRLGFDPSVVYLFHDPCKAICAKSNLCLCGHVHSLFSMVNNVYNVGVDVTDNYQPVTLSSIIQKMLLHYERKETK